MNLNFRYLNFKTWKFINCLWNFSIFNFLSNFHRAEVRPVTKADYLMGHNSQLMWVRFLLLIFHTCNNHKIIWNRIYQLHDLIKRNYVGKNGKRLLATAIKELLLFLIAKGHPSRRWLHFLCTLINDLGRSKGTFVGLRL